MLAISNVQARKPRPSSLNLNNEYEDMIQMSSGDYDDFPTVCTFWETITFQDCSEANGIAQRRNIW